ncbi:MAG: radical SAM/SPASM domain-containing protein [Candidatus Sericytochromatia bacterium]|nr:radical SAM/SPASM domain-containing protein [Candidatus Sericytochromatia bacterium]
MRINKGNISLSRLKQLGFHLRRGRGHLPRYMVNRFKWHVFPRIRKVADFPDHVDIEISSACDMKCPMCYTITDAFKASVKKGLMDWDLYTKLVDECARNGVYSIRLSLRGEPFVHPRIIDMIRYAKEKGIREVSTLTNGLKLNPEKFTQALEAGLDWLTISFDGLGETYEKIRRPAKFEEALAKIREYKAIKDARQSVKPVIKIQSVWPAIKDDPEAFFSTFAPIADEVASNPLIDYLHNDQEIEYEERFECPVLYQRLVVGSDGRVLLCVNDEMGKHIVGDANAQSLKEVWHGPALMQARADHMRHLGVAKYDACRECFLPRKTRAVPTVVGGTKVAMEEYVNRPQEVGK